MGHSGREVASQLNPLMANRMKSVIVSLSAGAEDRRTNRSAMVSIFKDKSDMSIKIDKNYVLSNIAQGGE